MKILVTGGDGFIGSKYIQEMEKLGHECYSFDRPKHDILDTVEDLEAQDAEMIGDEYVAIISPYVKTRLMKDTAFREAKR